MFMLPQSRDGEPQAQEPNTSLQVSPVGLSPQHLFFSHTFILYLLEFLSLAGMCLEIRSGLSLTWMEEREGGAGVKKPATVQR